MALELNGTITKYYDEAKTKVKSRSTYVNNKQVGWVYLYYEDTQLLKSKTYYNQQGLPQGDLVVYYNKNNPSDKGDGYKELHCQTNVGQGGNFSNFVFNGPAITYFNPNLYDHHLGIECSNIDYKLGIRDGKFSTLTLLGNEIEYAIKGGNLNNKLSGDISMSRNDIITYNYLAYNGNRNGYVNNYTRTGVKINEDTFSQGIKNGQCDYYFKDYDKMLSVNYNNGKLIHKFV